MNLLKKIMLALSMAALAFRRCDPTRGAEFCNIGEGTYDNGVKSYLPDATTDSRYLIYKEGSDGDHVALCGAGEIPLGCSDDQADSTTTPISINLFGAKPGTVRVITDG